jgi:hypothetical protein
LKYYISIILVVVLIVLSGFSFAAKSIHQFKFQRLVSTSTVNTQVTPVTNGQKRSDISPIDGITTDQERLGRATGNTMFENYQKKGPHGLMGRIALDEVHARGIEKTPKNFRAIIDLLKSNVSNEEKISLARMLARFYSDDDANGWNIQVLDELRRLTHSGDKELAKESTLSFSRLGYFADSEDVLLTARNVRNITDEDYYGELTHILPFAPSTRQKAIAETIRSGGNIYPIDIFSAMLPSTEMVKKISPDALAVIKEFVLEHEPKFPQAPEKFGLVDVVRYGEWLKSVAVLSGDNSGRNANNVSLEHISDINTDPRKIIAFLISSDGDKFISAASSSEKFRMMQRSIDIYAAQNAGDNNIQDMASMIRDRVNKTIH